MSRTPPDFRLSSARRPFNDSFTLIELLVVIAVIAILAALLLPALDQAKFKAQGLQCMYNHRQLCLAWKMYSDDNHDVLLYASGVWPYTAHDSGVWVSGWMDFNPNNPSNWDVAQDIEQSPLWPYCGNSTAIWKCPADDSFVIVDGEQKPRVRSMSMNLWLGGFKGIDDGLSGDPQPFAQGGGSWQVYLNMTELINPGPSEIFVFLDMRQDSIDVGNFAVNMTGWPNQPANFGFYDLPGFYHHLACGFSFADGHSEMHRWHDGRTMPPLLPEADITDQYSSPNNPDVAWLQIHATRPKQ